MRHLGQQTVIISLAPAQTVTVMVECHTWNDAGVYLCIPLFWQQNAYRFHDVEGTFAQVVPAGVQTQFHGVGSGNAWQVHVFSFSYKVVYETTGAYLVIERTVQQNAARLLHLRVGIDPLQYRKRQFFKLCLGELSFLLSYEVS